METAQISKNNNNAQRLGAIWTPHSLKIRTGFPSGPVACDTSRLVKQSLNSLTDSVISEISIIVLLVGSDLLRWCRGGSTIFLWGGAPVSCSTSTPINHIFLGGRIPVVLENHTGHLVEGGGGRTPGTLPQHPPRWCKHRAEISIKNQSFFSSSFWCSSVEGDFIGQAWTMV